MDRSPVGRRSSALLESERASRRGPFQENYVPAWKQLASAFQGTGLRNGSPDAIGSFDDAHSPSGYAEHAAARLTPRGQDPSGTSEASWRVSFQPRVSFPTQLDRRVARSPKQATQSRRGCATTWG